MKDLDAIIQESFNLLSLKEDWDGYGADTISKDALERAHKLLKHLEQIAKEKYNNKIDLPSIDPCPDGSIDLYWNYEEYKYALLINVKANIDTQASYYFKKQFTKFEESEQGHIIENFDYNKLLIMIRKRETRNSKNNIT
jgi:hypothetical protein